MRLEGALPEWLRGRLIRTAPGLFRVGDVEVEHWFDGYGILYAFELGDRLRFKQRLPRTRALEAAERGKRNVATFASDTKRSLFARIFKPVPEITDNVNVNVVPWRDGAWLAMTESPHHYLVDPETLELRERERFDDRLPATMGMTAHPQLDHTRSAVVNLGTTLGPKSAIVLYRQALGSRARVVEARIPFKRVPYVHSFGLSPKYAVIMDHPFRVNPASMLFSNRAFAKHFRWEPEKGARLLRVDRETGEVTPYDCPPFFCFHVINQFDDGDDVVLDFVGFDDATIVDQLYLPELDRQFPPATARPLRARLRKGHARAELEPLADVRMEFPQVDYARRHGRRYARAWGTAIGHRDGKDSAILRIDLEHGDVAMHDEPGVVFGEPVFVGHPDGAPEEGVILTVGTREGRDESILRVLDAERLEPIATLSIDIALPLGFHGNFARAR